MDRNKFEVVLRTENKKIFNYLLKILRNREDAEDLLQEVFISFYKKMDNVNEKTYIPYLFRTAYHKSLNLIKSRKKKEKFSQHYEDLENIASFEDKIESDDKSELIRKCIRKLPEKQAFILEMQFYQKMSYKEIAELLSTTPSAIDSKLVRAKKKLKKIILQEMKENPVNNSRGAINEWNF